MVSVKSRLVAQSAVQMLLGPDERIERSLLCLFLGPVATTAQL